MVEVVWFIFGLIAILLLLLWSSFRERQRILRQVVREIDETGAPAGPLESPRPTYGSVIAFTLGAAGMFPLAGVPFAVAALVLASRARREAGSDPLLRPGLDLAAAATAFAVGGLLVSALTAAHLALGAEPFHQTPAFSEPMVSSGESPFSGIAIVTAVVMLVVSAVFHECAHGVTAYWWGDDTARKAGRLTLNPVPHLDLLGSILLPLMLVLMKAPIVLGWAKPVPVRMERLRDRRLGAASVSSAGVAVNMTGALLFFALFVAFGVFVQMLTPLRIEHYTNIFQEAAVTGYEVHPLAIVAQGLKFGVFINLALAIFNLAPLPPLDGSNLLESLLPPSFGPLFGTVRSLGCLLLPFTLGAAFLMMLFVFLPAAWLLFHFLGAFLVRM